MGPPRFTLTPGRLSDACGLSRSSLPPKGKNEQTNITTDRCSPPARQAAEAFGSELAGALWENARGLAARLWGGCGCDARAGGFEPKEGTLGPQRRAYQG
eukprot:4355278-Pyramimonas_sp.AAC.1